MAKNTVTVSVLADTKAFQSGLQKAGDGFKTFAKAGLAVAAVGAAVATAVGVKAVNSASKLEQAMGGLNAVFKDQAQQMEDWANSAATNLGLAKSEYADLATVIGSQLKNMGLPMEAVAGQTNDLIGLGADLAAQFGGSTSDAVSALSSLLRGERDPIERYGVSINEAAIQAKLAEMGLSGLTGEAEKNAKLQATLALLTQQTADAQGAFARESTTLAGAQARARAGTEDLFAVLGFSLLPAVTAVTAAYGEFISGLSTNSVFSTFTSLLTTASIQFSDWVFGVMDGTKTLADLKFDFSGIDFTAAITSFNSFRDSVISQAPNIITALIDGLVSAASTLASVAGSIVTALVNGVIKAAPLLFAAAIAIIQGLVQGLTQALPTLLLAVAELIPTLIGQLLLAIPSLIIAAQDLFEALVVGLSQAIPALLTGLTAMWSQVLPQIMAQYPTVLQNGIELFLALVTAVATALPQIVDAVTTAWPSILDAITAALPQILEAGKTAFLGIVQSVTLALPSILTAVISMSPRITASLIQMTPALIAAGVELFRALVQALPVVIPQVAAALRAMAPEMRAAVLSIGPALAAAGGEIISGLIGGLQRNAGRVASTLTSIASNAVNSFKSFLGIRSPSRLFESFGVYVDQGLANGLKKGTRHVKNAVGDVNRAVTGSFDAELTPANIQATLSAHGASSRSGDTYHVNVVGGLDTGAEIGRRVIDSIKSYHRSGGRQVVTL